MFGCRLTDDTSLNSVHNYFAQINPIALRIAKDIEDIKSVYGYTWNTLNFKSQSAIISDALIKSDISIKYINALVKCDTDIDAVHCNKENHFYKKNNYKLLEHNGRFNKCSFMHQEFSSKVNNVDNDHDNDEKYCVEFEENSESFSNLTNSQINFKLLESNDNDEHGSTTCNNTSLNVPDVTQKYRGAIHSDLRFSNTKRQTDLQSTTIYENRNTDTGDALTLATSHNLDELTSSSNGHLIVKDQSYTSMYKKSYQSTLREFYDINSGSGILLINSPSSSIVSDNDDDSLTILIQEEESNQENAKLLSSDDVRRAFDFLNNW